ncbi:MAG: Rieske (2Fe-2S) protein, partial [Acidimicrobiaceae bacterium]|nr:Rieske (2Fe-2S) protein [Acidimicrobiaceae bacterium]
FNRTCTHAGALVSPGAAGQLACPAHGSVFNASTGEVIQGPAERSLTQYKASERNGGIYITL